MICESQVDHILTSCRSHRHHKYLFASKECRLRLSSRHYRRKSSTTNSQVCGSLVHRKTRLGIEAATSDKEASLRAVYRAMQKKPQKIEASSSNEKPDPYKALGLRKRERSSLDTVKSTYSCLALLSHPDGQTIKPPIQRKHAPKRMCEINVARDILFDAERRRAYDEVEAVYTFEFEEWGKDVMYATL